MRRVTSLSPCLDRDKRIKPDLSENENPEALEAIRQEKRNRDIGKVPLRINAYTIVMVDPELCTPQHAEKLRAKFEKARKQFP
ncbi:hypothetical protein [Bacteroides sp. UBA939]|uniref:hypothetical protein n=1 Tax=Bacteroides sp. UBA939 TaxID=1946092 RepID=UPI0025C204A9|nr:hypothetical protein [Bacteroides sp. UBA939]